MARRIIETDPVTGEQRVVQTAPPTPSPLALVSRIIWIIIYIFEFLILLRIIFELLNARNVGFANFLYSITDPLVSPFRGIFPGFNFTWGFLDTAAIVSLIVVALVGWIITALIDALTPNTP